MKTIVHMVCLTATHGMVIINEKPASIVLWLVPTIMTPFVLSLRFPWRPEKNGVTLAMNWCEVGRMANFTPYHAEKHGFYLERI